MGYPRGATEAQGISPTMRHKILGACLDFNIASWLLRSSLRYTATATSSNLSIYSMTTKFDTTSFPDQWIVDGGATAHFTGHVTDFTTRQPITPRLVKGMNLFATATGKVKLEVPSTSKVDHTTKSKSAVRSKSAPLHSTTSYTRLTCLTKENPSPDCLVNAQLTRPAPRSSRPSSTP